MWGNAQDLDTDTADPTVKTSLLITYEIFTTTIWVKMQGRMQGKVKVSEGLDAAVVWTEIKSHIKGSLEAMKSNTGYITREQCECPCLSIPHFSIYFCAHNTTFPSFLCLLQILTQRYSASVAAIVTTT